MKKTREEWLEPTSEDAFAKKNPFESQKKPEIATADDEPKRSRKKNNSDTGSRWVAPILLAITVLLSLLFQLFKQK